MRWMIYGADSKTGRELSVVVEADDPKEAADWMYYNDILVSSVAEFTAATHEPAPPAEPVDEPAPETAALDYHAEDRPPDDRPPLASPPQYRDVLWGARWLHAVAILVQVVACLLLVLGGAAVAVGCVHEWQHRISPKVAIPAIAWLAGGGVLLSLALLLLFLASVVSMTSGLALAVRDVARNSFDRPRLLPAGPPCEDERDIARLGSRPRVVELIDPDHPAPRLLPPRP